MWEPSSNGQCRHKSRSADRRALCRRKPSALTTLADEMASANRINNVADARRLAHRILPRAIFDYIDGGAEDEVTMAANLCAFRNLVWRPRMATGVAAPNLTTTILDTELSLPVVLAPVGLVGLMHPDGALGVTRAAKRFGTVSVLSTVAGMAPEGLANEPGPRWFQLYAADRRAADALIHRVADAGFEALVVTIDTPAIGKRERDIRNGFPGSSLKLDLRTVARLGPQVVLRPGWAIRMPGPTLTTLRQLPTRTMRVSPFTWEDIAWMRERWKGSLLVKGVLSGDDALRSADAGADAVIVSNHGGRQLEGSPASLQVLPEVVDAASNAWRCSSMVGFAEAVTWRRLSRLGPERC